MAVQYWQLQGKPEKCEFLAFDNAYHGDTLGAAALGGIHSFHGRFQHLGFRVHHIRDADSLSAIPDEIIARIAGVAIEPLIQGAAGMRVWPTGMLDTLRKWCDWQDVLLIADEVMTGFGRTGTMFACEQEQVIPDFLALSKGITGGYLPLGATLTTERIFSAFLGPVEEMKTFYYGHSYCGNQLGCAAALASLQVFADEQTLAKLPDKISLLAKLVSELRTKNSQHVGAVRQVGMIVGIDIVKNPATGELYPWSAQMGVKICAAARKHGLLTRPVRDTLVLMPPLSINEAELRHAVQALSAAISEVCA
jgi:adenosylmethionine---8-amino-7-oxononanoate aminotransferase